MKDDDDASAARANRRRRLAKINAEDPADRAAKDLEVSQFYLASGDFPGAYNRAKDAVRLFPDDPEAHFLVAAAAQKMKKNDEAESEYLAYLKLEPGGEHVKATRKALEDLHK